MYLLSVQPFGSFNLYSCLHDSNARLSDQKSPLFPSFPNSKSAAFDIQRMAASAGTEVLKCNTQLQECVRLRQYVHGEHPCRGNDAILLRLGSTDIPLSLFQLVSEYGGGSSLGRLDVDPYEATLSVSEFSSSLSEFHPWSLPLPPPSSSPSKGSQIVALKHSNVCSKATVVLLRCDGRDRELI